MNVFWLNAFNIQNGNGDFTSSTPSATNSPDILPFYTYTYTPHLSTYLPTYRYIQVYTRDEMIYVWMYNEVGNTGKISGTVVIVAFPLTTSSSSVNDTFKTLLEYKTTLFCLLKHTEPEIIT